MENYKQKHKDDLEAAKGWLAIAKENDNKIAIQILEKFFPELRESDDERIRKMLIEQMERWHKCALENNVVQDIKDSADAIAWLKKQSKESMKEALRTEYEKGRADAIAEKEWSEEDEIVRSCIGLILTDAPEKRFKDYNLNLKECLVWLEKQGEKSNYNPYKVTIESIVAMVEKYANCGDLKDFYDNVKVKCKDAIEYDNTWLEKQGEQKSKDRYTFNAIPRLLEMIEPTNRAKSYCQKLIDSLLQEGYTTDAKMVSYYLKQMNSEKVAMATMDEQKSIDYENATIIQKDFTPKKGGEE